MHVEWREDGWDWVMHGYRGVSIKQTEVLIDFHWSVGASAYIELASRGINSCPMLDG